MAFGPEGYLYTVNQIPIGGFSVGIDVFTTTGEYVRSIGDGLFTATSVAVDFVTGDVYATDQWWLYQFKSDGTLLNRWGTTPFAGFIIQPGALIFYQKGRTLCIFLTFQVRDRKSFTIHF